MPTTKGKGYANFVDKNGEFYWWFRGKGAILDQAERQVGVANGYKIRWCVAEERAAEAIRKLLKNTGIEVVHTPDLGQ